VNNSDQKLFGGNLQLPIFATRFEINAFSAVNKRKVLWRKTLTVKILVVSLPSASNERKFFDKKGCSTKEVREMKTKEKFG
jgi:hypothetical protein